MYAKYCKNTNDNVDDDVSSSNTTTPTTTPTNTISQDIIDSKRFFFFSSLNYENKNSFQSSAFQLDDICVASIPFAKTVGVTCTPRER